MNGTKGALASTGVWGGIIASIPAIDALLVAFKVLPFPAVGEVANLVIPLLGGLLSIFGRVKADKKIKGIL
jgi:hypothetical protein